MSLADDILHQLVGPARSAAIDEGRAALLAEG